MAQGKGLHAVLRRLRNRNRNGNLIVFFSEHRVDDNGFARQHAADQYHFAGGQPSQTIAAQNEPFDGDLRIIH